MPMLLLNVFGGLAIFLFGMRQMSDGLHAVAGDRMRLVLRFFSANRLAAILSGTLVTAVIQSSSASTVMVIGFINAGLLTLTQAIGIIFGANIGTTVTAQLVAFEISWVIMPAIIVGLLLSFSSRRSLAGWGITILGLGFLFLGMQIMSDELKQLSTHPMFTAAFRAFDCRPVDGVMPVGAVFGAIGIGLGATLIIQSSSACTGIVIALGGSGAIDLYTAVALVLGSNIGTTVTAQLAAIPANRVAKQAALAHTLFNVAGVILVTSTFWITWGETGVPVFFRLIDALSGDGDLPRRIANAHTVFNVLTTLVLMPFIPVLAKVCEKVIPVRPGRVKYQKLNPILLETPAIALDQTAQVLRKMVKKSWYMIDCALRIHKRGDTPDRPRVRRLEEREQRIDELQRDITGYLAKLMTRPLAPEQAERIPRLLHCANDAERIGDHTAVVRDLMLEFADSGASLGREAEEEYEHLHEKLAKQAKLSESLLESPNSADACEAAELAAEILRLSDRYEKNHLKRMERKSCAQPAGLFYLELLSEIRKVSRHLSNIAERAALEPAEYPPNKKTNALKEDFA